jgi:hypothetical protein
MRWFDRIPLLWFVLIALWLLVAPVAPEPHLIEKLRWLVRGELIRPLDIFDLLLHSVPALLLGWRLWRDAQRRKNATS